MDDKYYSKDQNSLENYMLEEGEMQKKKKNVCTKIKIHQQLLREKFLSRQKSKKRKITRKRKSKD